MASGHEYRANRPNTWLHRPMLQSEDSPCQPGAVHTWPKADLRNLASGNLHPMLCQQPKTIAIDARNLGTGDIQQS